MTKNRPVACITGASRGIGAETSVAFARRGYDVVLVARTRSALEQVAERARLAGAATWICAGDLADLEFAHSIVHSWQTSPGRIDVLVNNAAWREIVTMRDITIESWQRTVQVCLTTPAFLARWAAEMMEQAGRGVIVNVSSVQSVRSAGLSPAYVACKGAMDALTRELAVLYGPRGIRVIGLNPGAIDTEMSQDHPAADGPNLTTDLRAATEEQTPLRRWGTAEEMAQTIVWLASDAASYITGTSIFADGGLTAQFAPYSFSRRVLPEQF